MIELRQHEDFAHLIEISKSDPVLIFKHSTQCPISAAAYDELMRFSSNAASVPCGVVLVIENRSLSRTIASELGVPHESPQAIVVENGRRIWTASHRSITENALRQALRGC